MESSNNRNSSGGTSTAANNASLPQGTAPPTEASHLRKRFHSLINPARLPLKETNNNVPSPYKKTKYDGSPSRILSLQTPSQRGATNNISPTSANVNLATKSPVLRDTTETQAPRITKLDLAPTGRQVLKHLNRNEDINVERLDRLQEKLDRAHDKLDRPHVDKLDRPHVDKLESTQVDKDDTTSLQIDKVDLIRQKIDNVDLIRQKVDKVDLVRQQVQKEQARQILNQAQQPPQSQQNQQSQQKVVGRLAGEELLNWQQAWRKIMKESTVYFEGISESNTHQLSEYKRASKYLKQVGCEISPFYDNDVTIIVSRRQYGSSKYYPSNDIFSNVSNLKIKVWDYDKVFRFLKNLGVNLNAPALATSVADPLPTEPKGSKKDNLLTLLKEEKIYGSTDRDPNAKRDDLIYLENNYLYVYDLSQKVRPIAVREWQDDNYPVLNLSIDGKCPFIFEPENVSERKKLRRLQKFEAMKEYRSMLKQVTYDIMNNLHLGAPLNKSGFGGTSTSTDRIDESTIKNASNTDESYHQEQENQEVVEAEIADDPTTEEETIHAPAYNDVFKHPMNISTTSMQMIAPPALIRNSSCIQPASKFQDVAASGYNGASNALNFSMDSTLGSGAAGNGGNGLGPTTSQVPSRDLNNLKRRIIMKKQQSRTALNTVVNAQTQEEAVPEPVKEERENNTGYCENCRVKYDHFDDHIKSNRHRNFASDDRNFKEIDNLIATLKESQSLGYVTSNGDYRSA